MISVGTDPTCDWQIRAAFVPPRAFSILLVAGNLFVRSGPEHGVLLNGKAVEDGWTPVPHHARIDVGLARLEVALGYGDTPVELIEPLRTFETPASGQRAIPTIEVDVTRELEDVPFGDPEQSEVVPALLDEAPPASRGALKRYALLGVITVSAYGGWIALLDYL